MEIRTCGWKKMANRPATTDERKSTTTEGIFLAMRMAVNSGTVISQGEMQKPCWRASEKASIWAASAEEVWKPATVKTSSEMMTEGTVV